MSIPKTPHRSLPKINLILFHQTSPKSKIQNPNPKSKPQTPNPPRNPNPRLQPYINPYPPDPSPNPNPSSIKTLPIND